MKFTIPDTHISYGEGHRSLILPTNLPKNCLADWDKPNIIKKSLDSPMFPKNFISIETNDSQIFDNQSIPNIDDIPTNYLSKFHPYFNNQSVWFPKTSSPGPSHPPATVVYTVYLYIYNYIYTKETVFERISHNKQVLDGLGDAAAHASTNWMTLYFSQDLRSADQFSEAKQTQPVHLQHHPACHSSML